MLIYVAAALLVPDEREVSVSTDATQSQEPEAAPPEEPAAADQTTAQLTPPQPPFPPEAPAAPVSADADEVHRRRRSTIGIVLGSAQ